MNRNDVEQRVQSLQKQLAQMQQAFEQSKANINAIMGALQFAEDLLKLEDEPKDIQEPANDPPVELASPMQETLA